MGLQQKQNFKNEPSMEDKILKKNEAEYKLWTWSDWAKSLPHAGSLAVLRWYSVSLLDAMESPSVVLLKVISQVLNAT